MKYVAIMLKDVKKISLPQLGLFVALLSTLLIATIGVNTMPMLIGSAVESLKINPANAGLLASLELGSVAFSSLILTRLVSKMSLRTLAVSGGMLAIIGHASICFILIFPTLLNAKFIFLNGQELSLAYAVTATTRVLAGLGAGAALAAFSAAIANTEDPDRTYARLLIFNVSIYGFITATLMRFMTVQFSFVGTYSSLGIVCLVLIFFLYKLPQSASVGVNVDSSLKHKFQGGLLIVSLGIYAIGEGAIWAFAEQIGVGLHLSQQRISSVIGVGSVVGVFLGAGLATYIGTKFGRKIPLVSGLLAFGFSGFLLATCNTEIYYEILICLFIMSLYFILPYYMGAAASLDNLGRWASASTGMYLLGDTFGPSIAGQLIKMTGAYHAVGWLVLFTSVVPVLMMMPVLKLIENALESKAI